MKLSIAPIGGGYLIYPDASELESRGEDTQCVDSDGLPRQELIEHAMATLGYLLLDRHPISQLPLAFAPLHAHLWSEPRMVRPHSLTKPRMHFGALVSKASTFDRAKGR